MIKDGWSVPPELDQLTPRTVGPNRIFKFSMKVMAVAYFGALTIEYVILGSHSIISSPSYLIVMTVYFWMAVSRYWSTYYKEKKLIQFGYATAANIISEIEHADINSRKFLQATSIAYSFADIEGNLIVGKRDRLPRRSTTNEESLNLLAKITNNPTVLYDPKGSSKNILYPGQYATCRLPSV